MSYNTDLQTNNNELQTILNAINALPEVLPEQSKTATPSLSSQIITPDSGKTLSSVQVSAITKELLANLDSDFIADNIAKDVDLFGLVGTLESGGGTISGRKFVSGEITFSETPTSEIIISHDSLGVKSEPMVFLSGYAGAPSSHTGALIIARRGSGVYVNSSNRFTLLSSLSVTIDCNDYVYDTSFTIKSSSATKMLAGKTYIWLRIER